MSLDGLEALKEQRVLPLRLGHDCARLRVLCLGAHADDIEIGCAGTLLKWLAEYGHVELTWVVFSAAGSRAVEARRSARALARRAASLRLVIGDFEDTRLAVDMARAQAFVRDVASACTPDVVLTHRLDDRHQDHRLVAELSWQTWRQHLLLEYEIPKYEGDLGQPNLYVPLAPALAARKLRHLQAQFGSQRGKHWFTEDAFRGLMALRGLECRAAGGLAEAFHLRKAVI